MKKQHGFSVLTLLIAAVAIFGILSAVVSLSRSGATVSSDSVRPISAAIVTQGNNLATAFTSAVSRGIADSAVTYGSTLATPGSNDMLNPTNTGLSLQSVPDQAFASGAANKYWVYRQNKHTVTGVGSATADYTFILGDLTQTVCQEINRSLFNSTGTTASTPVALLSTIVGTVTAGDGYSATAGGTISALTGGSAALQGCQATGDSKYFYYVVVEAQ